MKDADREGEAPAEPQPRPIRKRPVHGVKQSPDGFTVVFVTVCTHQRRKVLANDQAHKCLLNAWWAADAWLIGRYVIMPDHVHLFAGPSGDSVELDRWVRYWKSMFTRAFHDHTFKWQPNHWDTRMRGTAQYQAKWEYVKLNPVRHGLVVDEEQWPYQGEIHQL